MKKYFCAAAAAILSAVILSSCGKTVELAGSVISPDALDALIQQTTAAETTAPASTEVPTEPTTFGAPEKLKVNFSAPSDYKPKGSKKLDFETVMQKPELPTGCEITSLTQTLRYYGFDADKVEMADVFLPLDYNGYNTMNEAYLGDPHADNGFGCNAPVIIKTAGDYFDYLASDWYAEDLTDTDFTDLFYQIDQGRPVIVWVTIDMRETYPTLAFKLGCGEDFYFNWYQHCVTIYGYDMDKSIVYTADPLVGNTEYPIEQFQKIYEIMNKQAVVLCGNEESAGVDYSTDEEKDKWLRENRPELFKDEDKGEEENKEEDKDVNKDDNKDNNKDENKDQDKESGDESSDNKDNNNEDNKDDNGSDKPDESNDEEKPEDPEKTE